MNVQDLLNKRLTPLQRGLIRELGELGQDMDLPAYLVGGLVRDLLLGHASLTTAGNRSGQPDLDVVVVGNGIALAQGLAKTRKGVVKVYRRFGTATVTLAGGLRLDLVTARQEVYPHPAALPKVRFSPLRDDLYRRDFTINAMAVALAPQRFGRLIDPFGGLADLRQGLVRILHPHSFIDDPTRIFRAMRFEQRFQFVLETVTAQCLQAALVEDQINRLSADRIWNELRCILEENRPEAALVRLDRLGVMAELHPQCRFSTETAAAFQRLRHFLNHPDVIALADRWYPWRVYWLAWMADQSPRVRAALGARFPLTAELVAMLKTLPQLQTAAVKLNGRALASSRVYRLLHGYHLEALLWLAGRYATTPVQTRVVEYLARLRHIHLSISGRDLQALGVPAGPLFQEILRRVLEAKLDGQVAGKSAETAAAKRFWQELQGR